MLEQFHKHIVLSKIIKFQVYKQDKVDQQHDKTQQNLF